VKPSDFADKDNERIYNAMLLCDKPPHKSNVWQSLINNNLLQSGDVMRLSMAIVNCEMSLDFDDYADAVKNYSLKRNSNKPLKIRGAL
jgi:replicative DNA helicase